MDDDEEIQSHPSPDSGSPVSPSSPPPNGRITVTVAAAPPQNTLTLALPMQQQTRTTGNGGGGGGREDCWSEGATAVLIGAWGERYVELSRGNLKQKHWKEVADIVSSREDYTKTPKTDIQCKNRIDTVKKKYKSEKSKIAAGGGPSKWPFYNRLDELIGPTAKPAPNSSAGASGVHKVPIGIPVGIRSFPQFQQQQQQTQRQKQKQKQKQKHPIESESESEPPSPISADSLPPETYRPNLKRPRTQREFNNPNPNPNFVRPVVSQGNNRDGGGGVGERREKNWGNSVRELTKAIVKFGEAYEQTESSKLQQLVEMEKQRMKFAKELELQRMQFFMKTQLELSQLKKQRRRVGNNSNHHHHHHHNNNNNNNNINNNSDSSS